VYAMSAVLLATKCTCYLLAAVTAFALSPLFLQRPVVAALDDMQIWGLKGPGLSTLTPNMRGIYYLSGNMAPWNTKFICNRTQSRNNTLCRNGFKRSQLFLLDTSHCVYDASSGTLTLRSPALGISEHPEHGGGMGVAIYLQLLRVGYTFSKADPEFAQRPSHLFEGKMSLSMLGVSAKTITGVSYRVTAEDVRGDGSVIMRYTWRDVDESTPAKKKHAFHEYTYAMKRVMDGEGRINRRVLKEMKQVYGDRVIIPL